MKRFLFAMLMSAATTVCMAGSESLKSASFQEEVKLQVKYEYLIALPEGYEADSSKRWPMVLFLHGSGERGEDLKKLKKNGPPQLIAQGQKIPAIVVAPQCLAEQMWNPHAVKALADEIQRLHRVDEDRVYLTGLSMGGFGTWEAAMEYPEEWAALVPVCGGVGVRFVMMSRITAIPQWIFHGALDPVIPVSYSQKMHDGLKQLGAKEVKLTIYPDAKHDSWTQAYAEPELWQWLFSQKRGVK
jgi:predicted peptidase